MKTGLKLLIFILTISFATSCNHSNTLGKMIPKHAFVIVHVNGRALSSKMSWEEVKQSSWFTKFTNDTSVQIWMKKVLDNPETSGIDNKGDLVLFVEKGSDTDAQIVIEGDIKDEKEFTNFCKNISASDDENKQNGVSILRLKNNGVVGWNNKKFAFLFDRTVPRMNGDSTIGIHSGFNNGDLTVMCKNLFDLKEDSSMRNNNNFTTLLNETADVHIWQNSEEILKSTPALGMLGMLKLDVFIKNNVSTYAINFENGKIDVKQKLYTSKELMDVLKKYGGGSLNTEMIKNIPTQDIDALVSLHFKPQGIAEILKLTGIDGMLNIFMAQAGFNLDDFVAANKGDVLFVASNMLIKKDSTKDSSRINYQPNLHYLFAASIGDKSSFNKLMNGGKTLSTQMKKDSGINYMMNDKYFVLGNDPNSVNKYNAGGNNSFTFMDEIKDHPIALYIDLNKILGNIAAVNTDTASKPFLNANAKMWDKIYSSGGNIEDDAFQMHMVVTLVDKSTNSLKQINNLVDLAAKLHHSHKINFPEDKDASDSLHRYMDSSTVK